MRDCRKCGLKISSTVLIDGRSLRTSQNRSSCYGCVPWGSSKERVSAVPSIHKICGKHPLAEWKIDSGGYKRCRKCCSSFVIEKRRRNMRKLVSLFGNRCFICGYSKSSLCMDFHHIDPSSKRFQISSKSSLSLSKLIGEAKKCILLCKNCHAEVENGIAEISDEHRSQVAQLVERLTVNNCSFRGKPRSNNRVNSENPSSSADGNPERSASKDRLVDANVQRLDVEESIQ